MAMNEIELWMVSLCVIKQLNKRSLLVMRYLASLSSAIFDL